MATRRAAACAGFSLVLLMAAGCGDNIVTATQKILNGQICQLSANEIKALNQSAVSIAAQQTPPVTVPTLTDAQAAALSKFAAENSLCTQADLQNLQSRINNGPPFVGVDELAAAFGASFDANAVDAEDIATIFRGFIGG
jgi:hypothetical protein